MKETRAVVIGNTILLNLKIHNQSMRHYNGYQMKPINKMVVIDYKVMLGETTIYFGYDREQANYFYNFYVSIGAKPKHIKNICDLAAKSYYIKPQDEKTLTTFALQYVPEDIRLILLYHLSNNNCSVPMWERAVTNFPDFFYKVDNKKF